MMAGGRILLLGLGMQGKAVIPDCVSDSDVSHIIVVDNGADLAEYLSRYPSENISYYNVDAGIQSELSPLLRDADVLYLKKYFVKIRRGELVITVDKMPEKVGIDPYYYFIDKNTNDNLINVEWEASEATSISCDLGWRKHRLTDVN